MNTHAEVLSLTPQPQLKQNTSPIRPSWCVVGLSLGIRWILMSLLQKVIGLGLQLLFLAFTIVSLSSRAPRRSMRNTIDDILRVRGLLPPKKYRSSTTPKNSCL